MWSILADLVVGIFDFVIDVLLFRGLRRKHGRSDRGVAADTLEVARFDFVTMVFISMACAGLMLLLTFGLGLPVGWSVGIGIIVGAVWGGWRYVRLVRER
ncbi:MULTISPECIES: hypothetical protein [unclassified Variovorax]|uniref:hypothetical protein n=1 Tax=unclassified Variovorax TaxID=663243 RepID=UPI003F46AD57